MARGGKDGERGERGLLERGGKGGEGGLLSFALSRLSLFSFCQSAQSMNQTARPHTALIKETAKHSSVRQVLTARFCACLVLRDRSAFFCESPPAAVHTNHPSIKIAEQKQIATIATQAHEGYRRCACSGSSQSNACDRYLQLKCLCLPASFVVSSSIAKCRLCDDGEHNSRRPRRLNVSAADSLLI